SPHQMVVRPASGGSAVPVQAEEEIRGERIVTRQLASSLPCEVANRRAHAAKALRSDHVGEEAVAQQRGTTPGGLVPPGDPERWPAGLDGRGIEPDVLELEDLAPVGEALAREVAPEDLERLRRAAPTPLEGHTCGRE